MFCPKCGALLPENAKFCNRCGASAPSVPEASAPQPGLSPLPPIPDNRKHGPGFVAGTIAAAAAVLALLAIFAVPAIVRAVNPRIYLASCLRGTLSAYAEDWGKTADAIGVKPLFNAIGTDCMEIDYTVKLDEVPDMAILRGAGLEVSAQFDLKNRQAAYQAAAQYGSAKLGTVQLSLLDDLAAFGSPELTKGKFYGVHTETLGADLHAAGWDAEGVPQNFGFNLFDLIGMYRNPQDWLSSDTRTALVRETAGLLDNAAVKKAGKSEQMVNGAAETLKMYTVSLQTNALAEYFAACAECILTDPQLQASLEPLALASGMTPAAFEQKLDGMLERLDADNIAADLPEQIQLRLGIRGRQVAFAALELSQDGEPSAYTVELGVRDSLINALTITAGRSGQTLTLASAGSHEARDGAFSDKTSLSWNGESVLELTTSLDTKKAEDNFSFSALSANAGVPFVLCASGAVRISHGQLTAELDSVQMQYAGQNLSFSLDCAARTGGEIAFSADDPQILTDMSAEELENLLAEIEGNAKQLILGLLQSNPALLSPLF